MAERVPLPVRACECRLSEGVYRMPKIKKEEKQSRLIPCPECGVLFTIRSNLKRHVRKKHPDTLLDFKFSFKCSACQRGYKSIRGLRMHQKSVHNIVTTKSTSNNKCPLCHFYSDKQKIIEHFETTHNIPMKTESFKFNSYEEFTTWKLKLERETRSSYQKRSIRKSDEHIRHYFVCHRSGIYISSGKGKRKLKFQGSKKINAYCPASIKVNQTGNHCEVTFQSTHIGHENELTHLFLTHEERKYLAAKLAAKLPLDVILADIRNSISNGSDEFQRLHLLNKKDLHNIKMRFGINYDTVRHENDTLKICINEDDEFEKLVKEKHTDVKKREPNIPSPISEESKKILKQKYIDTDFTTPEEFIFLEETFCVDPEIQESSKIQISPLETESSASSPQNADTAFLFNGKERKQTKCPTQKPTVDEQQTIIPPWKLKENVKIECEIWQ